MEQVARISRYSAPSSATNPKRSKKGSASIATVHGEPSDG